MPCFRAPQAKAELRDRRVLVIEDESLVAMMLQDMLEDLGCHVVGTAARLDEALEKAVSLAFDVAILDVNLHGVRTFPIAEALARRGLRFIFSTGYGASALPAPFRDSPVLQKPFEQHDLERALGLVLG